MDSSDIYSPKFMFVFCNFEFKMIMIGICKYKYLNLKFNSLYFL